MTFNIQQFIDHDYATDARKDRQKGKGGTQEFFNWDFEHCKYIDDKKQ